MSGDFGGSSNRELMTATLDTCAQIHRPQVQQVLQVIELYERDAVADRDILAECASSKVATKGDGASGDPQARAPVRHRRRTAAGRGLHPQRAVRLENLHGRVVLKADLDAVTGARLLHILSGLSAPLPAAGGLKDERTHRTATATQRRALAIRDGGCTTPTGKHVSGPIAGPTSCRARPSTSPAPRSRVTDLISSPDPHNRTNKATVTQGTRLPWGRWLRRS